MIVRITDLVHHRPFPVPASPWIMRQRWSELLFMHWKVPADAMRAIVPAPLALDLWEGDAWIAVVPFRMSNVGLRGLPAMRGVSAFLELNVRTYVKYGDRPGVYFFSLDASSPIAVWLARQWYHLSYFHADMLLSDEEKRVRYADSTQANFSDRLHHYVSRRDHEGAPSAALDVRYFPAGNPYELPPGTREHWLIERYCLYAVDRRGHVYRGDIHHQPWRVCAGSAIVNKNTMLDWLGLPPVTTPPLLHYADSLDVVAWNITRCG
jgi:hypothetical protein